MENKITLAQVINNIHAFKFQKNNAHFKYITYEKLAQFISKELEQVNCTFIHYFQNNEIGTKIINENCETVIDFGTLNIDKIIDNYPIEKNDKGMNTNSYPQQFGKVLTYLKRYSLFTSFGISAEDDIDKQVREFKETLINEYGEEIKEEIENINDVKSLLEIEKKEDAKIEQKKQEVELKKQKELEEQELPKIQKFFEDALEALKNDTTIYSTINSFYQNNKENYKTLANAKRNLEKRLKENQGEN